MSSTRARPHHRFTDDGRRVREVLTYARRGSRLSEKQATAWVEYADEWVIPDAAVDGEFVVADWFGRSADLIVEIGSGVGEATVATAAARPDVNVLAFEVWRPGVADTLARVGAAGVQNVRLLQVDAVWSMAHLFAPASISELHTWFPDPWHKARHHKRRLVNPDFAELAASRLVVGGTWRLATDWADYGEVMLEVLGKVDLLEGGVVDRWEGRPLTKFERKGRAAERVITDLAYVRR
ncbi:MAG TPA: tRNA (guanosine(46)-N7)-methyltransferase TrmB [Marmoricola sp.]|nr:tRNA (guanosine(46)-N7)-methyltransferase TrmB [Marmoricola sp.]